MLRLPLKDFRKLVNIFDEAVSYHASHGRPGAAARLASDAWELQENNDFVAELT